MEAISDKVERERERESRQQGARETESGAWEASKVWEKRRGRKNEWRRRGFSTA